VGDSTSCTGSARAWVTAGGWHSNSLRSEGPVGSAGGNGCCAACRLAATPVDDVWQSHFWSSWLQQHALLYRRAQLRKRNGQDSCAAAAGLDPDRRVALLCSLPCKRADPQSGRLVTRGCVGVCVNTPQHMCWCHAAPGSSGAWPLLPHFMPPPALVTAQVLAVPSPPSMQTQPAAGALDLM
jgi:hypothetical protein